MNQPSKSAREKGAMKWVRISRQKQLERLEEIEHLASHGYIPERIAKELYVSPGAIARQAYRAAEVAPDEETASRWFDVARAFSKVESQERRDREKAAR